MKLYHFPRSGNSRCIRIALAEKGIEYEKVHINFYKGEHKNPEFLAVNPNGTVPAIELDGFALWEVTAILEYLEDKFPETPLLPSDPEGRAKARLATGYFDKNFSPSYGPLVIQCVLVPKERRDMEKVERLKAELDGHLEWLNARLEESPYLTGESFGIADCCFVPQVAAFGDLKYEIKPENKKLIDWAEKVKARPSFAASE